MSLEIKFISEARVAGILPLFDIQISLGEWFMSSCQDIKQYNDHAYVNESVCKSVCILSL